MANEDAPDIKIEDDGDKVIEEAAKADEEAAKAEPQKTEEPAKKSPEESDKVTELETEVERLKEYQRGVTPKLQEFGKLKEQHTTTLEVLKQLSGKTDSGKGETEIPIGEELAKAEGDLKGFRDSGYGENTYEVSNLKRTVSILKRQQKHEQVTAESQEETKIVGDYLKEYPKATPEHVNELTAIIVEKHHKGRSIDLVDAEEIWQGRNTEKVASQKTKEALETQDKAGKAKTQTGELVDTESVKDEEDEYRDIIAPADDTDFSIPPA